MAITNYLIAVVLFLAVAIAWGVSYAIRVFLKYRGKMLFICPETGEPAAVKIAAAKAAQSSLAGRAHVGLGECSRWPERQGCGQECLSQIGADPGNSRVWAKVADWYRGRRCASCGKQFGELHWHDHRPALMGPDRKTIQWSDLPADKLPKVFETHRPICWSCHIAESFRREHPELVVDRPARRGPMGEFVQ